MTRKLIIAPTRRIAVEYQERHEEWRDAYIATTPHKLRGVSSDIEICYLGVPPGRVGWEMGRMYDLLMLKRRA